MWGCWSEGFKNDMSGTLLELYRIRILGLDFGRIVCILKEAGLDQDWKCLLNKVSTESVNRTENLITPWIYEIAQFRLQLAVDVSEFSLLLEHHREAKR